jgi:D-alanyl-D-alanine carboxypeptidase
MMTRKARALGMSKTTYRNASGLPNDEQLTTARDQATLGRAIQDRFPRYYRYFSTSVFAYRGQSIRNHNRLLGNVEGVDGIKTGYTRASGFNLVTSMRRGNRHLVGVVLGGRSGGSRDSIMRNLLAENLDKGATKRTVAAITERNAGDGAVEVADAETAQVNVAAAEPAPMPTTRSIAPPKPSLMAAAAAALPPPAAKVEQQARPEPAPLTSGVIQTQSMGAIPGSAEPMKPVKVKTVQVKAGPMKLASAGSSQPAPTVTHTVPSRPEVAETSSAVVAKAAETNRTDIPKVAMPPQPANHGTGQGILGVLPASSMTQAAPQALAYADPTPHAQPQVPQQQVTQQNGAIKPPAPVTVRTGWIIQVGALESEGEAKQRIDLCRNKASSLLSKADPFTEPVVAKDKKTLYRARFAGLERDQAEAVCRTLKRADISCITVRN